MMNAPRSKLRRRSVQPLRGIIAILPLLLTGCAIAQVTNADWPVFTLQATQSWRLNSPDGRCDASGLLRTPAGDWLTVSDRGPTVSRLSFLPGTNAANLIALTNCFTGASFAALAKGKRRYFDSEGLAMDAQGRIYLCEEGDRWIVRCNPATGVSERLIIDWSPVSKFFDATDRNASFEGIAVGDGRLYIANERSRAMIIVVDLATLKVVDQFAVWPQVGSLMGFLHYSDLAWFEGKLWVLCRHHRAVLAVDPGSKKVLAEFHYQKLEDDLDYDKELPTGIMEGLTVTDDAIWLLTDNNGLPRGGTKDIRPTLVKCPRPAKTSVVR